MRKTLRTPLTPSILKFFINAGYEFCLSRFSYTGKDISAILLTPVKRRQDIKQLQANETLLLTREEPLEMVSATGGPPVMIELGSDCLAHFISYLSRGQSKLNVL